jgi:hypothetical protein
MLATGGDELEEHKWPEALGTGAVGSRAWMGQTRGSSESRTRLKRQIQFRYKGDARTRRASKSVVG